MYADLFDTRTRFFRYYAFQRFEIDRARDSIEIFGYDGKTDGAAYGTNWTSDPGVAEYLVFAGPRGKFVSGYAADAMVTATCNGGKCGADHSEAILVSAAAGIYPLEPITVAAASRLQTPREPINH